MSDGVAVALIGLVGIVLGGIISGIVTAWVERRKAAVAAASAEASKESAVNQSQNQLIDQLQEELKRYRDDNDDRVKRLEEKVDELKRVNDGYRAFIGVQRDHMAAHNIPLPPWPEGLPR